MATSPDPKALGKAIADLRRAKGLIQKQVVGRIGSYYSDERSYRRIEAGDRLPGREAAIAILATGLGVTDVDRINDALALAEYAPLTPAEAAQLQLPLVQPVPCQPVPRVDPQRTPLPRFLRKGTSRFSIVVLVLGSVIFSGLVALVSDRAAFVIATALLYASLYAASLLLECALDTERTAEWPVAAALFSLMLVSSVLALVVDGRLIEVGNHAALAVSFGICLCAAAVQWVIARTALSESAVVPLQFQALTAQTAHLKNTLYHLVIVVFFWLSPFHCIAVLNREVRAGHAPWVRTLVDRRVFLGRDLAAFSPEVLWFLLLFIAVLTIPMGARLLENLKSHSGLNTYSALLYLKAVLYFVLVLVCIIWYSSEIGALQAVENSPS